MQPVTGKFLRRCGWLSLATGGLWLVVLGPAYGVSGRRGVEDVSLFAIACLLPGWLVFWMASRYRVAKSPAFAMLSGTALRALFAGAAILIVKSWRGQVTDGSLLWLVAFYTMTLGVETLLVVRPPSETSGSETGA